MKKVTLYCIKVISQGNVYTLKTDKKSEWLDFYSQFCRKGKFSNDGDGLNQFNLKIPEDKLEKCKNNVTFEELEEYYEEQKRRKLHKNRKKRGEKSIKKLKNYKK